MVKISVLEPVLELLQDKEVQEQVEEVARLFFSNGNVTINLIPALLLGLLTLLLVLPLLGIPLLDILFGAVGVATNSGYQYGNVAYSGSSNGYSAPTTAYGYSARSSEVELTEEQKALYPELSDLRDKIEELQESEFNLRNHLYYNTGNSDPVGGTASNKISYTY